MCSMADDCVFCKIARKEIPAEVLYEDSEVMAFRDLNAKAPVHILFIPKKHISTLNDLDPDDDQLAGRMLRVISDVAGRLGIGDSGYRVVANCNRDGGQEVFHLHFHLLGGRGLGWPPG
jgi:histidine triad (HIT) family protein